MLKTVMWGATTALVFAAAGAETAGQLSRSEVSPLDELRNLRRKLAFRRRGILANNDGCDALYFPKDRVLTPQSFLDLRTTALAETGVGTVAYCTISSGFSFFTHDTKVGTLLTRQPKDYGLGAGRRNVAQELINQGADCLELVARYAHEHDIEVFWSFRMNDTHDAAHRPDKPYFLYPPLKEQHPDWLVGKVAKPTRFGRWSSVNYALPQVRDLAFRFTEEVCRNYDVDGIELDFFRHLCYFPSTANGGTASDAEREMMTKLLRRIRRMTEEVGLKRGRPILMSVRVPDSVGFNRDMGLDVERWLADGLVDILVTTGYFRLNPWESSVALGHKYGVAVYPCLSDSRVRGQTRFMRGSIPAYRARAVNAWAAGADGVHLFNYFNPNAPLWKELGSPRTLVGLEKLFFVTVRDGNPDSWLLGGSRYRRVPILTPSHPLLLEPNKPERLPLTVGEDFAAARTAGLSPKAALHVRMLGHVAPGRLAVSMNGHDLGRGVAKGSDWLDYPLPTTWIKRGENEVTVALEPASQKEGDLADWSVEYTPATLPKPPWRKDRPATRTVAKIKDGALLIADRGTQPGDYRYYRVPWGMGRSGEVVIEARLKVISGVNCIIFGNGETGQRLCFYPDRIEFYHNRAYKVAMDTTTDFHTYRLVIRGQDIQVFVDNVKRIDGKDCFAGKRPAYRNELAFGAANSTQLGEALWQNVRARLDSAACGDLVVRVQYAKK
ncbi:MAG: family 10 glycosylhydrolase [Kiritimatiellaeota bacterium]|nr:family 10 glycosylhydrolase [Kiritimatiellota bacterium]